MHIFGYKDWKHELTKYTPGEAVDFITNDLAPLFKAEGYKKKGRTWSKNMGEFSFVVSVQGNRWNSKTTGAAFELYCCIFVPSVAKVLNVNKPSKAPSVHDCIFGRILYGTSKRLPWEIFDNTDIEALKTAVATRVKAECLDVFTRVSTLEGVKELLLSDMMAMHHNYTIAMAVFCHQLGDTLHARQYFDKAINDQNRTLPYREKMAEIARRFSY